MVAHFPEDDSLQKRLGTEACIEKGYNKNEAEKEQEGGDWSDRIDQDPENTKQGKYYSEFVWNLILHVFSSMYVSLFY